MNTRFEFQDFFESINIPTNLEFEAENNILASIFNHSQKITPHNLYRYRSCSAQHINAFENDQVLLTSPKLFNDPYDSLLYIDRNSLLKKINNTNEENIYNKLVTDDMFRAKQEEMLGSEFIAKILSNPISDNEYRNNQKKSHTYYAQFLDSLISLSMQKLKQASYVGCFSEVKDSIIMWSHYANSHRGFVLNYDFNSMFNIEVKIQNKTISGSHFVDKYILPVNYSNIRYNATQYVDFHMVDNFYRHIGIISEIPFFDKLFYYKILLHKSLEWNYENEWRIIKLNPDFQNDNSPNVELIDYMRPKEIYLGYEISNEDRKKLMEISKTKGIEVHQTFLELFESEYKLSTIRVM